DRTLDLMVMSQQTFMAPSLRDFYKLEEALYKMGLSFLLFGLSHPRVAWNLASSMKRVANLLQIPYWSQTAYAFGDRVVQYHLNPHQSATSTMPKRPIPSNFLRERLKEEIRGDRPLRHRARGALVGVQMILHDTVAKSVGGLAPVGDLQQVR